MLTGTAVKLLYFQHISLFAYCISAIVALISYYSNVETALDQMCYQTLDFMKTSVQCFPFLAIGKICFGHHLLD